MQLVRRLRNRLPLTNNNSILLLVRSHLPTPLSPPYHRSLSVHSTSFVDSTAKIEETTIIGPFSFIGPNVKIGKETVIGAHCTILNCDVGDRVILHSGVRIGQDGFGFFPSQRKTVKVEEEINLSTTNTTPKKKPQELRVTIYDDVEIGANTTIDRGSWRNTTINSGTKIDNLVHIGHNVVIGRCCLIAGQTGIAGSTTVGDRVLIGGQVGIAQHLEIGSDSRVAAKSGVVENVLDHQTVGGYPSVDIHTFRRSIAKERQKNRLKRGRGK
jgi:UDP-3-O-[3-hydroxymyristoyl] glucosamine N-acyltransferase LpxD